MTYAYFASPVTGSSTETRRAASMPSGSRTPSGAAGPASEAMKASSSSSSSPFTGSGVVSTPSGARARQGLFGSDWVSRNPSRSKAYVVCRSSPEYSANPDAELSR